MADPKRMWRYFAALFMLCLCTSRSYADDDSTGDTRAEPPLIAAIEKQDVAQVRALLKAKADVNCIGLDGEPALWHAIGIHPDKELGGSPLDHTRMEIVRILLDHHANPNGKNWNGSAILSVEPFLPVEVTHLLFRKGADPNGQLLPRLVDWGSIENARAALEAGADPNGALNGVFSVFSVLILAAGHHEDQKLIPEYARKHATEANYQSLVRLLIRKGVNIEQSLDTGCNALMCAAYEGHTEIIQVLLEAGAEVDAKDGMGRTALTYAAHLGKQHPTVRELLKHGVPVGPLEALWMQDIPAFNALVEKGADLQGIGPRGETLLMIAAEQANVEIVERLLKKGFNIEGVQGRTPPLIRAIAPESAGKPPDFLTMPAEEAERRYRTVALLIEHGANVNAYRPAEIGGMGLPSGYPALWVARRVNADRIAQLLLQHEASGEPLHSKYRGSY